ncbi:MAG: hypothetical protein ACI82Q_002662, partial [Nonlabens sp.]
MLYRALKANTLNMKYLKRIILALILIQSFQVQGQQLKMPANAELAAEASRRFAIAVDAMSVDKFRESANALHWLMTNVPDLYDGLYINAYQAYEQLSEKATSDTQKEMFLDSMMISYDRKAEVFGLTDREINNKAYRYYKYWKSNKAKMDEGMAAYKLVYLKPNEIINNNIVSYMDLARRFKAYGMNITNEEVIDIYSKVMSVIELKVAEGEDADKLDRYKAAVNGLLTQTMGDDLNCEFINQNLAPPLDLGDDLRLAKKVFGLLLDRGCGDSPYIEVAAKIIQKQEPTEGIAKVLA